MPAGPSRDPWSAAPSAGRQGPTERRARDGEERAMSVQPASDLGRNTAVMAAGTTLSRITGFGRVFALAYAFNFGRLADAYNLANTVPNIVYDLILGGVLSATLIPVFVTRLQEDDEEDAWRAI